MELVALSTSIKVAVVGSREYPNLKQVHDFVMNDLPDNAILVSGGAKGVDETAERAARRRGLPVEIHNADWTTHGKRAGFIRNVKIVESANYVIAFWDGESRGTVHTINVARSTGRKTPTRVYKPAGSPMPPMPDGRYNLIPKVVKHDEPWTPPASSDSEDKLPMEQRRD